MKSCFFILCAVISLIASAATQDQGMTKGICVEIVGLNEPQLLRLFSAVDSGLKSNTPKIGGQKITSEGSIRLLNIVRNADGSLQFVEFTKGDFFIVIHPGEGYATATANLDHGFEYQMEFKNQKGTYDLVSAGVTSQGASEFKIRKKNEPTNQP